MSKNEQMNLMFAKAHLLTRFKILNWLQNALWTHISFIKSYLCIFPFMQPRKFDGNLQQKGKEDNNDPIKAKLEN